MLGASVKAKDSQSLKEEDQGREAQWELGVVWPDPGDQGFGLAQRLTSPT